MKIAQIKNFDIANGTGVGVSVFVSGCHFHCPGCFNGSAWSFETGDELTEQKKKELFDMISNQHIDHISILGGEPLAPENFVDTAIFIYELKERFPDKKIWLWTGYEDDEEILSDKPLTHRHYLSTILKYADYITYGRFVLEERNLKRRFSGSNNQRTIDLKNHKELPQ